MAVNGDFARQAMFVAQQLECSERYAAGLLHTVLVRNPNVSPIDSIELTLLEYHTYRRQFVDCLRYLLQAVFLSLSDDSNPLYHQLANYVRHQLIAPPSTAKEHLTAKILSHIQSLDKQLSKIQSAVQNAGSNTQISNGANDPITLIFEYPDLCSACDREYHAGSHNLESPIRFGEIRAPKFRHRTLSNGENRFLDTGRGSENRRLACGKLQASHDCIHPLFGPRGVRTCCARYEYKRASKEVIDGQGICLLYEKKI